MSISKGFLVGALLAGSCAWGAEDIKILDLLSDDEGRSQSTLSQMEENWQEGYAAIFIETFRLTNSPLMRSALGQALDKKLGKAEIYKQIDPRFREYFDKNPQARIRMDEIRWGGVVRDGIPPLKDPKVLPAKAASYLGDSDVVFGVSFNGKARAYPKRILAWHEMVKDTVGGQTINGVYCTLCGSMIVYDPKYDGRHYELGTSGFLYRSNKLMYDHGTKSMWSTLKGEPVLGPFMRVILTTIA